MSEAELRFLDREAEVARLRSDLQAGRSLLLHGPAGIGKSALVRELSRRCQAGDRELIFSSGGTEPAAWMRALLEKLARRDSASGLRERLGLASAADSHAGRAALARKTGGGLRQLLTEALTDPDCALVLDPVGFVSRAFYELLRDLQRATQVSLLLVARSAHMEDIGHASRFALPRPQRLALGPLPETAMASLFASRAEGWARRPANLDALREHLLTYAAGNPGVLLGLLELAREPRYWAGEQVKLTLLTIDFNLRHPAGAAARPLLP